MKNSADLSDVRIATVYSFAMAKRVFIQVVNVPTTLNISADRIEEDGQKLVLFKNDQKIGEFNKGSVTGWWFTETDSPKF